MAGHDASEQGVRRNDNSPPGSSAAATAAVAAGAFKSGPGIGTTGGVVGIGVGEGLWEPMAPSYHAMNLKASLVQWANNLWEKGGALLLLKGFTREIAWNFL